MKYLVTYLILLFFFSCHPQVDTNVSLAQEKQIHDSTALNTPKDMIITPEEWQEDSIFDDGSRPADWSVTGINDANQLKIFIKFLGIWIDNNNRDSIAAHIQYPLSSNKEINSPQAFLDNYDKLFNEKVKTAIMKQKFPQVFRDRHGARVGKGELWIRNVSKGLTDNFKIVSINN